MLPTRTLWSNWRTSNIFSLPVWFLCGATFIKCLEAKLLQWCTWSTRTSPLDGLVGMFIGLLKNQWLKAWPAAWASAVSGPLCMQITCSSYDRGTGSVQQLHFCWLFLHWGNWDLSLSTIWAIGSYWLYIYWVNPRATVCRRFSRLVGNAFGGNSDIRISEFGNYQFLNFWTTLLLAEIRK